MPPTIRALAPEDPTLPDLDATAEMAPAAAPGSLLAQARAMADRQSRQHVFTVEVGGAFNDRLAIRYRPATLDQLSRTLDIDARSGGVTANVELCIACCEGVLFTTDDGTQHELADDRGPVRIDQRLWSLLGWPMPPGGEVAPHTVFEQIFGGNALLVATHIGLVSERMQSAGSADPNRSGLTG